MSRRTVRQVFVSLSLASSCFGAEVSEKDGWKLGMEIELSGEHVLAAAFRYMEFTDERGIKSRLNPFITNEILNLSFNPQTFLKLPPELQARLSAGVVQGGVLSKPQEEIKIEKPPNTLKPQRPTNFTVSSGLLGADGRPISDSSAQIVLPSSPNGKLERTASGIILPEGTQSLPQSADASKAAWNTISERWKKMSREEKLPLIAANDLPKDVIAAFYKKGTLSPNDFIRRADLPQPIAELMDRLEWVPDPFGPLEFRHRVPVTDPNLLKKDVETFARMVGIHRFISDPTKAEPDVYGFSFHVHVSKKGSEANLAGEILNRLRLIELFDQGRHDAALNSRLGMGYKLNVKNKGLIRVVDEDRLEGRIHTVGFKEEVDRLVKYLGQPADEMARDLKDELQKGIEKVFKKIEALPSGSLERQSAIRVLLAINPIFRFPEEMSEDVAKALREFPDAMNLGVDIAKLRYQSKNPHVVWQKEIDALNAAVQAGYNRASLNSIAKLATELERTLNLLDNLPCDKAFELLPASNPRWVF